MARLKPARLRIRRSDRAAFIGQTGSGKTTLAKSLLWGQSAVYVLDPKRTFSLPANWPGGWEVIEGTDVGKLEKSDAGTWIIRPGVADIATDAARMAWANVWCWHAFNRGKCLLYVDEVMAVTTPRNAPSGFAACLQMGRERGVGTWSATQRPTHVPLIVLTESQHFFVFKLRHRDDRERMAEYTTPELAAPVQHNFGFWYYSDDAGARYYQKADIGPLGAK